MKSILITTLGEPSVLDFIEYVYGSSSFIGRSTLPILMNNVNPKPEITVVIVLDTVIDAMVSSYEDLIEKVKLKYRKFIIEIGLDVDSLEIVVAPGVGRFQPTRETFFNFIGELSDYRAYIMYSLSKILHNIDGKATIHLDLTHGINFMPSLALLTVKEISSILALVSDVNLKLYNAEPYRKGITNKLNVYLVNDSPAMVEYDLAMLGAKGKCNLLKCHIASPYREKELQDLNSKCEGLKRELNAFLSSIFNGLPLALFTFYPDLNELEGIIDGVVDVWKKNVVLSFDKNEIYVRRNLSFGVDFIRLVKIWLIAKILNISRKREVRIEELDGLRRRLFSKFSKKLDEMISRDLYKIKEDAEKMKERCRSWTRLCDLYATSKKFAPRDFLAHSGLEMNVTELKYDDQSLTLRYAEDGIANVVNGCMHGLSK